MATPELRAPTLAESAAIKTYTAAVEGSLKSTDDTGDKLATAAVSVATAYGAVIALVAPKDSTAAVIVALPFAAFAVGLVLGLWTQSLGISAKPEDALPALQSSVEDLVKRKRCLNRIALIVLGLGLVGAGVVVADKYQTPQKTSATAVVWLSPLGQADVGTACSKQLTMITGNVDPSTLTSAWVAIEKPMPQCPGAGNTLVLPANAIVSVNLHS